MNSFMSKGLKWPIWAIVGAVMLFLNGCAALRWADGTNQRIDPHVYENPVSSGSCIEQSFYAAIVARKTNQAIRIVIGRVMIEGGEFVGHAQAQIWIGERWQGLELYENQPYLDRKTKFLTIYETYEINDYYERIIK